VSAYPTELLDTSGSGMGTEESESDDGVTDLEVTEKLYTATASLVALTAFLTSKDTPDFLRKFNQYMEEVSRGKED